MLHKTLAAETTQTDQELGTFSAIVSAWGPDRERDVILPTAFDKTIEAWQRSGKSIPLLFEHGTVAVGSIDPHSMHPTEQGLVVSGEVDRETDQGKQVWKQIKAGTIGFSIGYMSESKPRKGGGRTLTEVDLLEISCTSTPMHPSARALSWKAAGRDTIAEEIAAIVNGGFTEASRERVKELAQRKEIQELAKKRRPVKIARFEI